MMRRLCFSVLMLLVLLAGQSSRARAADAGRTLRDLGYGDTTARTMFGAINYFFTVPRGQVAQPGSQIDIVYSHSPLLLPDLSTMTVVVNGQSVASTLLNASNANHGHLLVSFPLQANPQSFFVQVQFAMRLTRDTCEEPNNPALWATVHGDSLLYLPTRLSDKGFVLDDLDALFSPAGATTTMATLALPASASPEELDAAGIVAFQFGKWAAMNGQDTAVSVATALPADKPGAWIGLGSSSGLPSSWGEVNWNGVSFSVATNAIPSEHGVLALRRSTTPQLLVSGGSPGALRLAAEALAFPERRRLLSSDRTFITGSPVLPASLPAWREGAASFAQLGIDQRQFIGPGEHVLDLSFNRPAGWVMRDRSALDLVLDVSSGLRDTSQVSIVLNGIPIGTQKLRIDSAGSQHYRFALPDFVNADSFGQPLRALSIQARFLLNVRQTNCEPLDPQAAKVTVLPTSAWYLPHESFNGLDLGRFPAPFIDVTNALAPIVVVPDAPTIDELSAAVQVIAAMGRWSVEEVRVLPRLVVASRTTAEDRNRQNLILIGGVERNSVSVDAAKLAPALFDQAVAPAYRLQNQERRGSLRVGISPWSRDRQVLVVTGETPEAMTSTAYALARQESMTQIRGRVVNLVEGINPMTTQASEPANAAPSAYTPRVETNWLEGTPPWRVVGIVALGAFVAALLLFINFRWRRRSG